MSDELKLRKDAERGSRAQSLLDSELIAEAFENLEAEYVKHWRSSTALNDVQGRDRLWQAVQILGKVRSHLEMVAADGRMAATELSRLAQGG